MTFILPFDCNPPLDVRGVFLDISKVCDSMMERYNPAIALNTLYIKENEICTAYI